MPLRCGLASAGLLMYYEHAKHSNLHCDMTHAHVQITCNILLQELLACILQRLQDLLETLVADGFAPLQQAYLQAWLHTNQQVSPTLLHWHSMP